MKKIISLVFVLSISGGSALAWGWGDCPNSKKEVRQEAPSEKLDQSESSAKE